MHIPQMPRHRSTSNPLIALPTQLIFPIALAVLLISIEMVSAFVAILLSAAVLLDEGREIEGAGGVEGAEGAGGAGEGGG